MTSESICVGVRLRPFVGYEKNSQQKQCLTIVNNVVHVVEEALAETSHSSHITTRDFAFDAAMDSTNPEDTRHCDQAKCYQLMCQRMVGHITEGFHTCLFCYGQTGTGKTTTIMGDSKEEKEMGLLLRLLNDVFKETEKMKAEGSETLIQVQMLEVYNDKLNDLLHPSKDRKVHPEVRMNPVEGVYVKGSTPEAYGQLPRQELPPPEAVDNFDTVVRLIEYGNTMKTVAATAMNKQSSRGHTIFKLVLERKGGTEGKHITAEAFFVDLAGRENEKTTKVTGERMVELTFINLSLKYLADCIRNLGELAKHAGKGGKVNMGAFRNSKLTMLLANALSGNSKTAMIGTLSPAALNFDESYSTLQFASTVKSIKVDAKPAAEVDKGVLVEQLQKEVQALKEQLAKADSKEDQENMQQKMEDVQELCEEHQKAWHEKHAEAKQMMQKREEMTTKLGVCRWKLALRKVTTMQSGQPQSAQPSKPGSMRREDAVGLPHLTNFSEDPYLTGVLVLYPAEPERDYCGGTDQACDFVLPHGLGILPRMLYLKRNNRGQLWIWAADSELSSTRRHTVAGMPSAVQETRSSVEVNGNKIGTLPVELKHHDAVVLGRSLIFYVINQQGEGNSTVLHKLHERKEVEATSTDKSREQTIAGILGGERTKEQMDSAKKYVQFLQNFNRDAEGKVSLNVFLERALAAERMVDEANEITKLVWPGKDLIFQLMTCAPVLAFGFGTSRFPDLAVRLVRVFPLQRAQQRVKMGKARRRSSWGHSSMLNTLNAEGENVFVTELDEAKVDVLFTWSITKFAQRLQLMQEVREEKEEDPEHYKVDPLSDPWSEYGPSEVTQFRRQSTADLQEAKEEAWRLRQENSRLEEELRRLQVQLDVASESVTKLASTMLLPALPSEEAEQNSGSTAPGTSGPQKQGAGEGVRGKGAEARGSGTAARGKGAGARGSGAKARGASLEGRGTGVEVGGAETEARGTCAFDGRWAHDLDGDKRVELIERGVIRWQDGTEMAMVAHDPEHFMVELRGSIFRARLVRDRLEWDDGDVWTRVAADQPAQPAQLQGLRDELVQLLHASNSNMEGLRKTQQDLIQTVRDGIHSLDDKLTKATRAGETTPPTACSPMTPVPSMVSHIPNMADCAGLGTASPSGSYIVNPPPAKQQTLPGPSGMQQQQCLQAGVVGHAACASVAAAALPAMPGPATPRTPVPLLAPPVMLVSSQPHLRQAPSPSYAAASCMSPQRRGWGGSTPNSVAAPRSPTAPRSPVGWCPADAGPEGRPLGFGMGPLAQVQVPMAAQRFPPEPKVVHSPRSGA